MICFVLYFLRNTIINGFHIQTGFNCVFNLYVDPITRQLRLHIWCRHWSCLCDVSVKLLLSLQGNPRAPMGWMDKNWDTHAVGERWDTSYKMKLAYKLETKQKIYKRKDKSLKSLKFGFNHTLTDAQKIFCNCTISIHYSLFTLHYHNLQMQQSVDEFYLDI